MGSSLIYDLHPIDNTLLICFSYTLSSIMIFNTISPNIIIIEKMAEDEKER